MSETCVRPQLLDEQSFFDEQPRAGLATAHTNIALVKYWGKKNEKLRLPFTDSLSLTVNDFYTTTQVVVRDDGAPRRFRLSGQEVNGPAAERVWKYIERLQRRFGVSGTLDISTANHVPMSAGLASSSSAFAALAGAFAAAYELNVDREELSRMARLGSGSASRSVYGGFSRWIAGHDDATSRAVALDENPDLDIRLLAVQVDVSPKSVPSTQGMRRVVETSPYFPVWVEQTSKACDEMEKAIERRDFTAIGEIAQQNALDMHALNLTARPGFTYFQPQTLLVLQLVDELRHNGVECYSTMDAGSNVKVLVQSGNEARVRARIHEVLPQAPITSTGAGPGLVMTTL